MTCGGVAGGLADQAMARPHARTPRIREALPIWRERDRRAGSTVASSEVATTLLLPYYLTTLLPYCLLPYYLTT